ncbi:Hypothetical predicted protein [Mytilus galloprovincialis]|uniref:Antistasin-like domain-containing protein n=1 Tax=Mytilus galloprovincialis TaxID=29158 RepID=A0A8B6C3W5_MYTGA|nr:Hypothetical predicted protein [Mytilus galloprovincialis]
MLQYILLLAVTVIAIQARSPLIYECSNKPVCNIYCKYGYHVDQDGCDICKCKQPPHCSNVMCAMYCEHGFQVGADGCEICKCNQPHKIRTILDIGCHGCGVGRITLNMDKYSPDAKLIGIDVDNFAIETALKLKEEEKITNIEFYLMGAEDLKHKWIRLFDWVTILTVLHDLPNPDPCLQQALRVMKDDGVMTILLCLPPK